MYKLEVKITNDEDEDEVYELRKEYVDLEDLRDELEEWFNNDFELEEKDDVDDDDDDDDDDDKKDDDKKDDDDDDDDDDKKDDEDKK